MTLDLHRLKIHPAVEIMPAMTDDQYQELVRSVHEHGLLEPIEVSGDTIIDGRHRWRALVDLQDRGVSVEPRFSEWRGTGDPLVYIVQKNLPRRHMTTAQRACVAFEFMQLLQARRQAAGEPEPLPSEGGAEDGEGEAPEPPTEPTPAGEPAPMQGRSRDIAGRVFGVSGRTVERVAQLAREAPDLYVSLKNNDIPDTGMAMRELRGRKWEETKREREERAAAKAASNAPPPPSDDPEAPAETPALCVQPGEWWAMGKNRLYVGEATDAEFRRRGLPRECLGLIAPDSWDDKRAVADFLYLYCPVQAWVADPVELAHTFAEAVGVPVEFSVAHTLSCHIVGDQTECPVGFGQWQAVVVVAREGLHLDRREYDFRTVKWREKDGDEPLCTGAKPLALLKWIVELFTDNGHPVIDPYASLGAMIACHDLGRVYWGACADAGRAAALLTRWMAETKQEVRRL